MKIKWFCFSAEFNKNPHTPQLLVVLDKKIRCSLRSWLVLEQILKSMTEENYVDVYSDKIIFMNPKNNPQQLLEYIKILPYPSHPTG